MGAILMKTPMRLQAWNPSTGKAKGGGMLQVGGQPGVHSEKQLSLGKLCGERQTDK